MQNFVIDKVDCVAINTWYGRKLLANSEKLSALKKEIEDVESFLLGWAIIQNKFEVFDAKTTKSKLVFRTPTAEWEDEIDKINIMKNIIREIKINDLSEGITFFVLTSDKCAGAIFHTFEIFKHAQFCCMSDINKITIYKQEKFTLALIDVEEENG